VAEVPQGVTTGPVTIITPRGNVTTSEPFIVKSVRVQPATATVAPSGSIQFTSIVLIAGDPSVKWSVNGVEGGNQSFGTITTNGLYTAPSLPPFPIIVRATIIADPSTFGEASVVVRSPDFDLAPASASVSVARQPLQPPPIPITAVSAGVSIKRQPAPTDAQEPVAAISSGVSVRLGSAFDTATSLAAISAVVSIQRQPAANAQSPIAAITSISVKRGPNITSISPTGLVRGMATVITIGGANLGGATTIKFIDSSGALDTSIAVSDIAASADGSSLTATITPGPSTAPGRRLVIVSTATGNSPTIDTGTNTVQIIQ
jgi:hypothetical protein